MRRKGSQRLALLALTLALVWSVVPGAIGIQAAPSSDELNDATRFRSEFGLRSDLAFVAGSLEDASGFPDHSWGVPLTRVEAEDLAQRVSRIEDLQLAVAEAINTPGYAGIFFDQLRGGIAVFLFTDSGSARTANVRSLVPDGVPYEIRSVLRSESELQELKAVILASESALDVSGLSGLGVGIDVVRNAVYVGVPDLDAEKDSRLRAMYGDAVVIEPMGNSVADTCNGVSYCWPLKGGLRIYPTEETLAKCTLGFLGRRNDTNAMVAITAGHCIEMGGDGVSDKWGHSVTPAASALFGGELGNTWTQYADADVGLIQLNSEAVSALGSRNLLLTEEPGSIQNVTGFRSSP